MPVETLEQNDTNALLVASSVVSLAVNDFRSHILTSAHDRVGGVSNSVAVSPFQDTLKLSTFRCVFLVSVD